VSKRTNKLEQHPAIFKKDRFKKRKSPTAARIYKKYQGGADKGKYVNTNVTELLGRQCEF
jgi:hypothetical protein